VPVAQTEGDTGYDYNVGLYEDDYDDGSGERSITSRDFAMKSSPGSIVRSVQLI
jgi:hypothetical protein